MNEIIALRNEDIRKELFNRAQFVFWAAGGAMGNGGAVEIFTDDGNAYYCNYVYGDADIDLILEACPIIESGPGDLPEDFVFHYLGFGNFLVFRREYEEMYNKLLGNDDSPGYEYQNWRDIAVKLCGKSRK